MHVCTHRIVRTISTAAQCVGIILSCVPAMRVYLFRLAISVPAMHNCGSNRTPGCFIDCTNTGPPPQLADLVLLEVKDWRIAGFGVGGLDPFVRE